MAKQQPLLLFRFLRIRCRVVWTAGKAKKQKSKITKKAMQASFLGSVIDAYDFDW